MVIILMKLVSRFHIIILLLQKYLNKFIIIKLYYIFFVLNEPINIYIQYILIYIIKSIENEK